MSQLSNSQPLRIGLIAGWGRFPVVVAQALIRQGHQVSCAAIRNHADPILRTICSDYAEFGLARLGGIIRFFQRNDVSQATMAGKIHKVLLFERFYWIKHFPDWITLKAFYPHFVSGTRNRNDDTLLGTIVELFSQHKIVLAPATQFAPELLVKLGPLSQRPPTAAECRDIEYGWRLAKEIGRLDIGQTVVVKGQAVVAVEAVEGTDECIRRAGQLCKAGGFTVVKVAKPQQDMRFDVPTIGQGTLRTLIDAGGRVLAIEAHKTIFIDQSDVISLANQHRISIVALQEEDCIRLKLASCQAS